MKRSGALMVSVLMVAMGASAVRGEADYAYAPPGWYPGYPVVTDTIDEVLKEVDSPAQRSQLAEQWLAFSRQAIAKSIEQRGQWLKIQERQVQVQQQADQANVEAYRLQLQIEQLRADNLKLERENLELRQQLQARVTPPQTQPQS
ncbi:MAG: hypothetical protein A2Y77_02425 [Planctomycetes bacterium RBG_13_62_9]|nr:MAG: hypothetical protein A2Y77_02425 [Planctomycetes bacterium RBG_13_62_9]